MSNKNDPNQISIMFQNLTTKLDKMASNIDNIAVSLVNLTNTINESMMQVSDHLEDLIAVFEKTFQIKELAKSNTIIENISEKLDKKFSIDDFQNTLGELNELITTLKELKEKGGED
ncbi:MAG: hypothetical protein ACTSPY_15735 [Candidatus Helarchaeota archaeon]